MRPLVGQQTAQAGGLDVVVARHPAPQRALAVHHLVMADRQHVVLAERVEHRERHLVVVIGAVDRVPADVVQGVVHPAHVPLHREAKAAKVGRAGDAGPRGGLLGDGDDARCGLVHGGVHLLQELHRLEVLPAAVDVGRPAARRPGVVQVEHRCHRVDPQAVDVELLQPVQARWPPGSCAPRAGRSRKRRCPSRVAHRDAGRSARRARCRRTGPAPSRPSGSARAPSRRSPRCRPGAARRPGTGSRRGSRTATSARSTTSPGSPRTRRTGCSATGSNSTWVKPWATT